MYTNLDHVCAQAVRMRGPRRSAAAAGAPGPNTFGAGTLQARGRCHGPLTCNAPGSTPGFPAAAHTGIGAAA